MQRPPVLPPSALLAGKITVGLSWLFCIFAPLLSASSNLTSIAMWLSIFLAGSHAVELLIYSPFLKAARATTVDYVQVFLFGIFHSSGLQEK
jgi:uncharacterized protein YhhL (DUF1145 family)